MRSSRFYARKSHFKTDICLNTDIHSVIILFENEMYRCICIVF